MTARPDERDAYEAAARARAALAALGVPVSELVTLAPRTDAAGHPVVHMPTLSVDSINVLLSGLVPALGPRFAIRLPRAAAE